MTQKEQQNTTPPPDSSQAAIHLQAVHNAIVETAVDGMITIDASGSIQSFNPAAERIFGYSAVEMIGQNVSLLMPDLYASQHDQYLAEYLRTRRKKIIGIGREVEGRRKDGTTFPIDLAVSEVRLPDRVLFAGIVRDISDRKAAEARLHLLNTAIDDLQEGVVITDAQLHWPGPKILFVNPAITRITGYSRAELLGRTPRVLQGSLTHRGELARLRRELAAGKSYTGENVNYDREGRPYEVEMQISPVYDHAGNVINYVSTHRDVTERNQAQRKLVERENFLQTIFDTEPECVKLLGPDGSLISMNRAGLEMIEADSLDEVVGESVFPLVVAEDRDAFCQLTQDALCGRSGMLEFGIIGRKGTRRRLDTHVVPLRDPQGKITAVLGITRDITQLSVAQTKLVQAERLATVGQMLSAIAHESRNALQRIQAGVDVLRLEADQARLPEDDLRRIEKAKDDLQRLFEELRNFAAPVNLERSPVELSQTWRQAWNDLVAQRGKRDVLLLADSAEANVICNLDPYRMAQVFRNLMENSLAACTDPVQIEILCGTCRLDKTPGISIVYRDNGPGLNTEQERRIFEPFFTTKSKGTGLGMSIAQRIVEAHGGTIRVLQGDRGGVQFEIRLPR